jgi:hypothetical protein
MRQYRNPGCVEYCIFWEKGPYFRLPLDKKPASGKKGWHGPEKVSRISNENMLGLGPGLKRLIDFNSINQENMIIVFYASAMQHGLKILTMDKHYAGIPQIIAEYYPPD